MIKDQDQGSRIKDQGSISPSIRLNWPNQSITLSKSFHMDSDGQMVNGDISPSLMVFFKLQRCHKNLVVQRHLGEIAENKRDFYLGDKTSVLTFDIHFHKSVHMYGNRLFYKHLHQTCKEALRNESPQENLPLIKLFIVTNTFWLRSTFYTKL